MENQKIKVILAKPGEEACVTEIRNTLKAMQEIVGGLIETCEIGNECAIVINENGKFMALQPNRPLFDKYGNVRDILVGNIIIAKYEPEEGEFIDLTDDDIPRIMAIYGPIPTF